MVEKGTYSALGIATPPTYDGRWEVIRYQTATNCHEGRDYTLITTVTAFREMAGQRVMVADGPYASVGSWLVEYMRAADAANTERFEQIRDRLWRETDRLDTDTDAANEASARDALDKVHFDAVFAGGVGNWSPGFSFTP